MALHRVPSIAAFPWQPAVLATQNTPPALPIKGDRYIVAGSPTGAWVGYALYITTYDGSGWIFDQPSEGWRAYDINADGDKLFNGTAWQTLSVAFHAASHEAGGSDVVDADTLDTLHASAFAVAAKGVTNGDSHDHIGGDGAAIAEGALSLADVTTFDVSTLKHGFCPKAPNDTSKFLRGDGAWAAPPGGGGLGYVLQVGTNNTTTFGDGATYYIGSYFGAPVQIVMAYVQIPVPKAGTLKSVYLAFSIGTPATPDMGEEVNVYFRKNATDTLLGVVELTDGYVIYQATGLSVSVAAGDYICIKLVNPTFSYNPQNIKIIGTLYFE